MKVFCSYHFVTKDKNDHGFGNAVIQTEKEFPFSLSEIRRFEKEIRELNCFRNVVLLNFTVLSD